MNAPSRHGPRLCRLLIVCALFAGCASAPPMRHYTLRPLAAPAAAPAGGEFHGVVVVAPVTLPGTLDRPQLVARVAPNRVQLLDQERWAEPLKEQIARVLAANLARLLPQARVRTSREGAGRADDGPQWRLQIDVQQFEFTPGEAVVLEARWAARPAQGARGAAADAGAPREGRIRLREPVAGGGLDAAVAAHDRALARMSTELAAALLEMRSGLR